MIDCDIYIYIYSSFIIRVLCRYGNAAMAAVSKPRVILGTMTFSDQTDEEMAIDIIRSFAKMDSLVGTNVELDTARIYNDGKTEMMLGVITTEKLPQETVSKLAMATKANPRLSLAKSSVLGQMEDSMAALKADSCDLYYLHSPDANANIDDTLAAIQELYEAGKFKRFGVSNYTAWEVVWIHSYMKARGWVLPTIYQGMMNPLTRDSMENLLPALRRLGMGFNLYNPLAGGLLTGKYAKLLKDDSTPTGRFSGLGMSDMYRKRFMQDEYFEATNAALDACKEEGIPPAEAALRWCMHHAGLTDKDGIIIGVSTKAQFDTNMDALSKGPLPDTILKAYDEGWKKCEPVCMSYARGISGSNL